MIRSRTRARVPRAQALATMRAFLRTLDRLDGRMPARAAPEARR